MDFQHIPVLFQETIAALAIQPLGTYIDGTMGGGGHSQAILERLTTGRLLAIDQDPDAIALTGSRLSSYPGFTVVQGNFSEMDRLARDNGIEAADGILLDIGVSSHQLDTGERGFSYHQEAPLDMRMSQSGQSAKDLVNTLSEKELTKLIFQYGEDKSASRIARGICKQRQETPIETTWALAEIIKASVPAAVRREQGHPARKTFQALRIAVNRELEVLEEGLEAGFALLKPGGRLAVITFHSLEDRIVKRQMNAWSEGCICPKDFPVCICGKKPKGKVVYKRGLTPSPKELEENPRARSARLRVMEKSENNDTKLC